MNKSTTRDIVSTRFLKLFGRAKEKLAGDIFLLNSCSRNEAYAYSGELLTGIFLLKLLSNDNPGYRIPDSEDKLSLLPNLLKKINSDFNTSLFGNVLYSEFKPGNDSLNTILSLINDYTSEGISAPEPEALGIIYEYLKFSSAGKEERKTGGLYYTPTYIVDYIVERCLNKKIEDFRENISELKIYDPACGSGIFLLRSFDFLVRWLEKYGPVDKQKKEVIISNHLFGSDIDKNAIDIAKISLLLKTADGSIDQNFKDISLNFNNSNFLIRESPLFDHFPDKFNIIIGNPPYNAALSPADRKQIKKNFPLGTTDTAALFMHIADEKLESGGMNSFIIPKPFVYASNWKSTRERFLPGITTLIDCGRVWNEVKLEQVIYFYEKESARSFYNSGIRSDGTISLNSSFGKHLYHEFELLINGINEEELDTGLKIKTYAINLNDIADNHRGAPLQNQLLEEKTDYKVIGGKQILSYIISNDVKGYLPLEKLNDSHAKIVSDSVLIQNIVSFVQKPVSSIKIIAALSNSFEWRNYLILDTINQLHIKNRNYSPELICAVLNSRIMSWYVYNFIYGRAIRTMHFDNYVTKRIPLPHIDLSNPIHKKQCEDINRAVNKLIEKKKEHKEELTFRQRLFEKSYDRSLKHLSDEIELMIADLYNLSDKERKTIGIEL